MSILDYPLTLDEANAIAGGSPKGGKMAGSGRYNSALTGTSKMMCRSYNLPASRCNVGGRLTLIPESSCFDCYARKGRYLFRNTIAAMERHYAAVDDPRWTDAMVVIISDDYDRTGSEYFRWLDSGDIKDRAMLEKMIEVAERLPHITFWCPTQERAVVNQYVADGGEIPPNLTIRRSMPMRGMTPPAAGIADGNVYSMTYQGEIPDGVFSCHAAISSALKLGDSTCGDCRACWDPEVPVIGYMIH